MNIRKFARIIVSLMLVAVMTLPLTACKKKQKGDPEVRPLSMSIQTPDGVFNPFYSTSAYDSTVVGNTQISMLGSDSEGNVVCGENEPVVVKSYAQEHDDSTDITTYRFILKNGIKFSDGEPLTMKDVLFNLYVYLDPVYTGSATIYSTKIVGLEAYRTQNPEIGNAGNLDGALSGWEEGFIGDAGERIDDLIEYVYVNGSASATDRENYNERYKIGGGILTDDQKTQFDKDIEYVKTEFKKELESDWNSAVEGFESYKTDWGFTAVWQVFLMNDGGVVDFLQTDNEGYLYKDDKGNYKFDPSKATSYESQIAGMNDEQIRQWAIDEVYDSYFASTLAATPARMFESILRGWVTGDTVRDQFINEAKTQYFNDQKNGGLKAVPTITGIDGSLKTSNDFSSKESVAFNGPSLGAEHEVLEIKIRGVDPKAIWNFGFTVAPMHYYSSSNYNGKDYISSFDASKGEFGFEFGDIDFMENVINAPAKVGLPVGAGIYMASSSDGDEAKNGDEFFNNNIIYFQRNPYFETTGASIINARIKYLQYKVVESDQIINSLAGNNIDVGDPSATQQNIAELNKAKISYKRTKTSGYGYIGINPHFVPNITVRRAIMKSFDTSLIVNNYYQGGLAEILYRPMTNVSWAYPKDVTTPYRDDSLGLDYKFDAGAIEQMIKDAGYTKGSDGIYQKDIPGYGIDKLDYKFTIAGATTDHPAYSVFLKSAEILNQAGFRIKVTPSQTALSDLSTGKLTVWAAAWSSTIDPDMYQVYHMDSTATSVNNWGYKQIKANKTLYSTEWSIIQELSDKIDKARETLVQEERAEYYHDALDLVMQLAVEFPTYQRYDLTAYNGDLIDEATLTPDNMLTPYYGPMARMWEVNYKK